MDKTITGIVERISFGVGSPVLSVSVRTPGDGQYAPISSDEYLHAESGYVTWNGATVTPAELLGFLVSARLVPVRVTLYPETAVYGASRRAEFVTE